MLEAGTYELGPSDGRLLLRVFREGMAKKVGHDLVLELTDWKATVTVDGQDATRSTITASADARSLEIREASGGVKPLSDGDRADIKKNAGDKVLQTSRHPRIDFRSTSIRTTSGDRATVTGDLTLVGTTRPVDVDVVVGDGRARARFTLVQSQWGIKPFSALMGALKVRDAVDVELDVAVPR